MSNDENVIKLHPRDNEALRSAINSPPEPNEALRKLMASHPNVPMPVNLPDGIGDIEIENLGFEDTGAAFNMRDWLQKACEDKGARIIGGGFGFGQADIDIVLEGCQFNISIRPLPRS